MSFETILLAAGIYVVLGRWIVGLRNRGRDPLFAVLNLAATYFFFYAGNTRFRLLFFLCFLVYVGVIAIQFLAMWRLSRRRDWVPWIAFWIPIAVLVFVRCVSVEHFSSLFHSGIRAVLERHPEINLNILFFGVSYMSFRTSYLVLEVRNGAVPRPNFWQYVGFAFFAPTMSVGPINTYSLHHRAFRGTDASPHTGRPGCSAVLVGTVKYRFFGPLLNQLTYSGLLLDGHPHLWVDFPIAVVGYYLFLYCNFSGFCDIAIGGAGLMRISVAENFNDPFAARNPKDFWNRWHITLSHYMRDVVFSPLSKKLAGVFGPRHLNAAIATAIMIVFLLIGIWHGLGWHYAAFGVVQGIGVAGNHYYAVILKRRLGKERFAAYNRSRIIHGVAVIANFIFVAASMFLFAVDWQMMKAAFSPCCDFESGRRNPLRLPLSRRRFVLSEPDGGPRCREYVASTRASQPLCGSVPAQGFE